MYEFKNLELLIDLELHEQSSLTMTFRKRANGCIQLVVYGVLLNENTVKYIELETKTAINEVKNLKTILSNIFSSYYRI